MAMATVDYLKEYRVLLRNIAGCSVVMSVSGNAIAHPVTGARRVGWTTSRPDRFTPGTEPVPFV